jgi:hypothetical protein
MGEVTAGVPLDLAAVLVEALGLRGAVETGTHLGDSTRALRSIVPDVWTVELSPDYLRRAQHRLHDLDGIRFVAGSSDDALAELAPQLSQPMLYWLDAHWCELDTAGRSAQCPVLAEIAALDTSPAAAESCILIDDARFFLGAPLATYRRSDWPTFLDVVDALRSRHDRYVTVLFDVIIAGPPRAQHAVEQHYNAVVLRRIREERDQAIAERDQTRTEIAQASNPTPRAAFRRLVTATLANSRVIRRRS